MENIHSRLQLTMVSHLSQQTLLGLNFWELVSSKFVETQSE